MASVLAPALALYEKGKDTLFCPDFVRLQQRKYVKAVSRAHRIFVVGVRVNEEDEHIWSPLAEARAKIYSVSPDPSEFFVWTSKVRRRGDAHFANSFEAALPKILSLHAAA